MSRILIIDDDPTLRTILCRVLTREGYTVIAADNGRTGLACFKDEPTDLVITDVFMPEQEGLETIMALRRDHPGVAIIAISGGGSLFNYDCLGFAEKFGATHILAKPFKPAEIIEVVKLSLQRDDRALEGSLPTTLAEC